MGSYWGRCPIQRSCSSVWTERGPGWQSGCSSLKFRLGRNFSPFCPIDECAFDSGWNKLMKIWNKREGNSYVHLRKEQVSCAKFAHQFDRCLSVPREIFNYVICRRRITRWVGIGHSWSCGFTRWGIGEPSAVCFLPRSGALKSRAMYCTTTLFTTNTRDDQTTNLFLCNIN